jgi:hypothetical protein
MKFLAPVDLNQNELRNAVIQNLATAPASPKVGQSYFDTSLNDEMTWNGTAWVHGDATKATGIPNAALATNPLARANHTGTQTASTISDLPATVKAYSLDQFAAPAADLSVNSHKITNLADPVSNSDAATKNYVLSQVQSAAAGITGKGAVVAVATSNQASLSGTAVTIDGVALNAVGMRVLLTGQTTASQNGPWIVQAGAWIRPTTDSNNELETGALWFVEQGSVNGATQWWLSSPTAGNAITPGTTAVTIVKYSASNPYTASNGVVLSSNNFSAQVVAGGGVVTGASGLFVDTSVVARKYSTNIGDGASTSITITHNLNTTDIIAAVRDTSGNAVTTDWQAASANTAVFTFTTAPASNAYRVTVIG